MRRRKPAKEDEVGKVSVDSVMNDLRTVIFDLRVATNRLEAVMPDHSKDKGETGDAK